MRRAYVFLGTAVLLGAGVPVAASQSSQLAVAVEVESARFETEAEALAQDLQLMAQSNGWTVEEAENSMFVSEVVGRIAEEIAAERPDVFLGGVLPRVPGETPAIYIKGPADAFILDLISGAAIEIKMLDNQPFSFEDLERRKLQVHHALEAQGFQNVSTGFRFEDGGRIRASVAIEPGLASGVVEILRMVPADVRDSVDLTISNTAGLDQSAFGGMWMRDDGVNECSSGFSVAHVVSGTNGVTTAGHCDGINQILHGGLYHVVTSQAEHRGSYGDVEWFTSNEVEPDDFYDTSTTIRDVSAIEARANILVNEQVCLYGRGSNFQDCSRRVADVSEACTLGGVFNDRLVLMDGLAGAPGDSGGPWFVGGRAYGIEKGLCGALFNQAAWTVADLFDESLLISVLT